jgi:4,5:9,10-diseco-3-hydroxy-5,9,17-trioxoandrosta-1(10),2-diene-4-oate hydrolase
MPSLKISLGDDHQWLTLHYVAEGSGSPVLLLHGLGGFAESWRHNLPVLGHRLSVFALDLPGFGLSDKPPVRYRLPFFVRVMDGFIEALGLERVALVGHSLGGAIAAAYAVAHPWRVNRLALIGGVVPGFDYRSSWVYRLVALRGFGELIARFARPGLYRAALARCFAAPDGEEVEFLVQTSYETRANPEGRAAYLSALREVRNDFAVDDGFYRKHLEALNLPTLLIHGRQDPVVAPAHAERVAARLRQATLEWVDRCGHFPQIEHADDVNRLLLEFLAPRTVSSHSR